MNFTISGWQAVGLVLAIFAAGLAVGRYLKEKDWL